MQLDIVLLGSGNVAANIGKAFQLRGHRILQLYSRTPEHAAVLGNELETAFTSQVEEILPTADFYLLCLNDDAIPPFSQQLSKHLPPQALIAHTSGVNGPELIDSHFQNRSLFYPLQSFSRGITPEWSRIPFFIEGNAGSLVMLEQLAHTISPRVYLMRPEIRTHLHLASVFANNFSNFNLYIAQQILAQCNVPFDVICPLVEETVSKAFRIGPLAAQTGPARRSDAGTIEKHIRLLVSHFPQYRALYKKYSELIAFTFRKS
ncbi:MAG: DUF2520 domain-containing protein [Saprospiraceae bacterium]|nr:DUF2520 domain-containing protein [Saprospiraceae bacterium]